MPEDTTANSFRPVIAGTRIGHVHLKVADLDRALGFYQDVLGFELMQRYGDQAAFISAGGYHHHIGLNTWHSKGGKPPPEGTTGLFHTAILYPTRAALADALHRVLEAGYHSMVQATMALARRFTCAIRTKMVSNCIGTAPKRSGRAIPTERWRCSPAASTWRRCCASAKADQTGCGVLPFTSTMAAAISSAAAQA